MDFHRFLSRVGFTLMIVGLAPLLFATGAAEPGGGTKTLAVFIPGVMSGSPIYEMLASGVIKAAGEYPDVEVKVVEGGFNQAEWESKLTSLAASTSYDLIISSNPAIPALCSAVSQKFPTQRFLLLDGELTGNPSIYTLRYDQREQALMAGHLAALVTLEGKGEPRLGLVAGQEYPAMNNVILPGYLEGARLVEPAFTADFRVVGNWYDAAKGAELTSGMIRDGAQVILAIAGGANQGVVQAASEAGSKVVWFDVNGYAIKPGVVVGSAILRQDLAAYEQTKRFLEGTLPFGSSEMVGVADGYVDFVEDDPLYLEVVSEAVRKRQGELIKRLRSGTLGLDS